MVEEVAQVLNPLDQYQEDIKKKRQEQLDKRSQINIGNQLRFSATVKKDPHRGMGWVNASGSINQGKLGHSQSWKFKSSRNLNIIDVKPLSLANLAQNYNFSDRYSLLFYWNNISIIN